MSSFNSAVTPQHISAGQSGDHDSDCLPVIGLFPRTNLPDPEIPNIAAMSDGERRLWLASRRDPVVDQLPQARRTSDGYPPGDLQPGTQRKWAACVGAARPAPESVAPAGGAISPPCSDEGLIITAGFQNVGLRSDFCGDSDADSDVRVDQNSSRVTARQRGAEDSPSAFLSAMYADMDEAEAKIKAVEALLTLRGLKLSGRLPADRQVDTLAKQCGLVVQSPRQPRSLPMCDLDSVEGEIDEAVVDHQNTSSDVLNTQSARIPSEVTEFANIRDVGSVNVCEAVNTIGLNAANTRCVVEENVSDTWSEGSVEVVRELNSNVNTPARVLTPSLEAVGSVDHLRQLDRRQNRSVPPFGPGGTHVCSFGSEAPVNVLSRTRVYYIANSPSMFASSLLWLVTSVMSVSFHVFSRSVTFPRPRLAAIPSAAHASSMSSPMFTELIAVPA